MSKEKQAAAGDATSEVAATNAPPTAEELAAARSDRVWDRVRRHGTVDALVDGGKEETAALIDLDERLRKLEGR